MEHILCAFELYVMFYIFMFYKSNCYIFFTGYFFVTGVLLIESEIYSFNDGNYLQSVTKYYGDFK